MPVSMTGITIPLCMPARIVSRAKWLWVGMQKMTVTGWQTTLQKTASREGQRPRSRNVWELFSRRGCAGWGYLRTYITIQCCRGSEASDALCRGGYRLGRRSYSAGQLGALFQVDKHLQILHALERGRGREVPDYLQPPQTQTFRTAISCMR